MPRRSKLASAGPSQRQLRVGEDLRHHLSAILARQETHIPELDQVSITISEVSVSPDSQEDFIGYAEIRQVFSVSKSGKVAGCMVTEGIIKRGCKVRLLRDNVVIHEGSLKTLRRFKDEVKEVRESMECGMAFENYSDIQEGDMIECFEITEVARTLD